MEGKGEESLQEVVLAKVIIALVTDFEEVPYFLRGLHAEDMIPGSTAESEEQLNPGFSVVSAPVGVASGIGSRVGSRGGAVNDIPEASMFKDQDNHFALVHVVVSIIVEERNLILDVLRLWPSERGRSDGR